MLVWRWKKLPRMKTEEETLTREFWMFIGSFVLLLSAIQIAISTSIPVWSPLVKWITGKDVAPPVNNILHYDNIQVWVAIILAILSASVLYMRFKHSDAKMIIKRLSIITGIALVMGSLIAVGQKITTWQYDLMLFAACFGIVANFYYAIAVQKVKLKKLGPTIAHLGFATVLLGILLSCYNKHAISYNTLGAMFDLGKKNNADNAKESREDEILFLDSPVAMGDYWATYMGDSAVPGKDLRIYYKVDFKRVDSSTHQVLEEFMLYPDAFINPKGQEGMSANPSTKHYWNKDIFTFIQRAVDKRADTTSYRSYVMHMGDTTFLSSGYIVFNQFSRDVDDKRYIPEQGDVAVRAELSVYDASGFVQKINPIYYIRNQFENQVEDTVHSMDVYAKLAKIIPEQNAAVIMVRQIDPKDDFIVLKALLFPYINVLWLGVVIMVLGFLISLVRLLTKKAPLPKVIEEKPGS